MKITHDFKLLIQASLEKREFEKELEKENLETNEEKIHLGEVYRNKPTIWETNRGAVLINFIVNHKLFIYEIPDADIIASHGSWNDEWVCDEGKEPYPKHYFFNEANDFFPFVKDEVKLQEEKTYEDGRISIGIKKHNKLHDYVSYNYYVSNTNIVSSVRPKSYYTDPLDNYGLPPKPVINNPHTQFITVDSCRYRAQKDIKFLEDTLYFQEHHKFKNDDVELVELADFSMDSKPVIELSSISLQFNL